MWKYCLPTTVNKSRITGNKTFYYSIDDTRLKHNKYKTCDIYVAKSIIHIEKYDTNILTWDRKTKQISFSSYIDLYNSANGNNNLKIALMMSCDDIIDMRSMLITGKYLSFHDFHIEWSHLCFSEIYTTLDELTIPLDDQYSYIIQSTEISHRNDLTSFASLI